MKPNLVILDCETGGYDENKNPITEVALSVVDPGNFKILHKYQSYVKPYDNLKIEPQAIKATQIDMAKVLQGKSHVQVLSDLISIFRQFNVKGKVLIKPILVGHNINFDIKFLKYLFTSVTDKHKFDDFIDEYIDTQRMMMIKDANKPKSESESRFTLTGCCERMGIKLKAAHGAEADVEATTKLLKSLVGLLRNDVGEINDKDVEEKAPKDRQFFEF